jgi:hypothetical protein
MNKNTEEHPSPTGYSSDYDLRCHLFDTIILLGGKKEIAELLIKSQDCGVTASDIDDLRRYNCGLIDATKLRVGIVNDISQRRDS